MKILDASFFKVDYAQNLVEDKSSQINNANLVNYISDLYFQITSSTNHRPFIFQSDTTTVRKNIRSMLKGKWDDGSASNANRLLSIEVETQAKITHLNKEVQKGGLLQIHAEEGGKKLVILCKVDNSEFLDEENFDLIKGFPIKKKAFKSALINLDSNGVIEEEVLIDDSVTTLSHYWWEGFLELREKHTDEYNTGTSMDVIDVRIFNPMKRAHPSDHTILRNSFVGHFRNKEEFSVDSFVQDIFANYIPVSRTLDKEDLVKRVKNLPSQFNFDRRFSIDKNAIKKRQFNKIPLSDSIELVLKEHIDDIGTIIQSVEDDEGNKCILIKTDEGYNRFKSGIN